jgi:hypothetical protein
MAKFLLTDGLDRMLQPLICVHESFMTIWSRAARIDIDERPGAVISYFRVTVR